MCEYIYKMDVLMCSNSKFLCFLHLIYSFSHVKWKYCHLKEFHRLSKVLQSCNIYTLVAETRESSWRPAWATEWVKGQPGLHQRAWREEEGGAGSVETVTTWEWAPVWCSRRVYGYVCMWACAHSCRAQNCPGAGVAGCSELPDMGVGNCTWLGPV